MLLKFKINRNLFYLFVLYIFYLLRKFDVIILSKVIEFNSPILFIFLMSLGEIFGGMLVIFYQKSFFKKKKKPKYFDLDIIHNQKYLRISDNIVKIGFLIFLASFFDFVEFIIAIFYIPKVARISPTIDQRLACITTISSSLICTYALKFNIGKHQKFSILFLFLCFIITILIELIYKKSELLLLNFLYAHFLVFCFLIFITFTDSIERYLVDNDYINPFYIIMLEGCSIFIMSSIYSIAFQNPFDALINYYNSNEINKFIWFIKFIAMLFIPLWQGL